MAITQETPKLVLHLDFKGFSVIPLPENIAKFIKIAKTLRKNKRLSDEQMETLEDFGSTFSMTGKNTAEGEFNEYWIRINLKKKIVKVWL